MDRDSRRLSHHKGNKVQILPDRPTNSDGYDGDMAMVNTTLYIKTQGSWISFAPKEETKYDWHGFDDRILLTAHGWQPTTIYNMLSPDANGHVAIGFRHNATTGAPEASGHNQSMTQTIHVPKGAVAVSATIYGQNLSASHTTNYALIKQPLDGTSQIIIGSGMGMNVPAYVNLLDGYIGSTDTCLKILITGLDEGELVYGGHVELRVPESVQ